MKTYNEFINEGLFDFFSKLFKGLMDKLDEESKKVINDSLASLEKTKNMKDSVIILKKLADAQNNSITNIKDLKGLNNLLKEDIVMIDMFLKSASKKYSRTDIDPKVLYKESTNPLVKNLFVYKNDDDFQKKLDDNTKNLFVEIATKGGMKKEDVEKAIETIQESKIFEADDTTTVQETPEFKKVKDEYSKFQKDVLYGTLIKKFEELSNKGRNVASFDEFAKTVKSTKNVQSVKKIINKLADIEKPALLKVRDAQGLTKNDAPL